MNDLISRSEVLELLYKIFDEYYMSTDKNPSIISKSFGTESFGIDVFKEIKKKMPTAYDIDKVVERLEIEKRTADRVYDLFKMNTDLGYALGLNEAIEIVKQGSVSDDTDNACEWKKLPFSWFAGCDGRKVEYKQGDYCPRCGKKIKVVK